MSASATRPRTFYCLTTKPSGHQGASEILAGNFALGVRWSPTAANERVVQLSVRRSNSTTRESNITAHLLPFLNLKVTTPAGGRGARSLRMFRVRDEKSAQTQTQV